MLDDATRGANHQGIALEAEPYRYAEFEDLLAAPGTILVLDHLQDPQNVGTLFRAAEAAGVAGVVIPADRAAAVTPAVVNASAGAVEHLRVAAVPNLARALEALQRERSLGRRSGCRVRSASDIFATEIPTPAVLVVGAEGAGLGANLRKHCDLLLALPMRGRVDSLNAATAGAIASTSSLRRERGQRDREPRRWRTGHRVRTGAGHMSATMSGRARRRAVLRQVMRTVNDRSVECAADQRAGPRIPQGRR